MHNPQREPMLALTSAILTVFFFLLPLLPAQSQADTHSDQRVASFIESVRAAQTLAPEFEELERQMDNQNESTMMCTDPSSSNMPEKTCAHPHPEGPTQNECGQLE